MSASASSELSLRELAIQIWTAGVQAVDAEQLVRRQLTIDETTRELTICGHRWPLDRPGRICVVGAGKAGAGMAAGVEAALGSVIVTERVTGWVNVPENCVRPLTKIHLHAARPAGMNEPTAAGVAGTEEILRRVSELGPDDLCLVLISGGGSALLPAPVAGVSLAEKLELTRFLSQSGATIHELNAVRSCISQVKGGGLARACGAGTLVALIISDVIGDPLSVIASGPTVLEPIDPEAALVVLKKFDPDRSRVAASIWKHLESAATVSTETTSRHRTVWNQVIGNNRVAVDAATDAAHRLGARDVRIQAVDQPGIASEIGRELARECLHIAQQGSTGELVCLISGGEPTVRLAATDQPRKGGRNQELVLAGLCELQGDEAAARIVLLSGGTDGEDGPTDAAGAVVDAEVLQTARAQGLDPRAFLAINNSYEFFQRTGGLLVTGPTHTNVMDLRVGLVRR